MKFIFAFFIIFSSPLNAYFVLSNYYNIGNGGMYNKKVHAKRLNNSIDAFVIFNNIVTYAYTVCSTTESYVYQCFSNSLIFTGIHQLQSFRVHVLKQSSRHLFSLRLNHLILVSIFNIVDSQ